MRQEGKVPTDNMDEFIDRTVDESIKDSFADISHLQILERGLPGYFFIEDIFKRKLPEKYFDYCKITAYSSPVFVLEPIYSFDMSKPREGLRKGRIASLQQRISIFEKTKKIYHDLGYNVEVIPTYYDDIQMDNDARIKHVLNFISKI
jgi:hypothetical protein